MWKSVSEWYETAREYSVNTAPAQYTINTVRSVAQPYLTPTFEATKIVPHVYIGNFASASNKEMLKYHGFKHIIVAAYGLWEMFPQDFKYKRIDVIDSKYSSLRPYFQEVADYIHDAVSQNEKVLVHCVAGVSRSASLVAAYLILTQGYTPLDALKTIRAARPQVNPNESFLNELHTLEPHLYIAEAQTPGARARRFHSVRPLEKNEVTLQTPTKYTYYSKHAVMPYDDE